MRGTPGGSQYLCTGSFVLSKVCRAPNGGLTVLNFSAAQGVIGAFSGFFANGSAESQLFSRMPSGPWKSGSQIPERSGMPPDIRAVFCADFMPGAVGAVWAGKFAENASTAPRVPIKIDVGIRIFSFLMGGCLPH